MLPCVWLAQLVVCFLTGDPAALMMGAGVRHTPGRSGEFSAEGLL